MQEEARQIVSGINRVICTANLTKDPVLRATADGRPVCDMRVAMTTRVRDADDVCYIDVSAWEKQAQSCAEYLSKGS